jgi:hypothetical protein
MLSRTGANIIIRLGRSNLNRLGRNPLQRARPAPRPRAFFPGRPAYSPRLGLARPSPRLGLAPRLGRTSSIPRLGRLAGAPVGLLLPRDPAGPDQKDPAWPGFSSRPPLSISAGPDYTVPAGPARDPWPRPDYIFGRPRYSPPGRITPLWGWDLPPRNIFLVQRQLQPLVPVLGRLQARTGTSSIIICWSWDASWLRPAYPSSPSQSYPQEENKTDDMVILKTDTRRRRPRTPSTDIDGTSPRP